jgi:hypothetical protein
MAAMVGSLTVVAGAKCDFYGRISTITGMGLGLREDCTSASPDAGMLGTLHAQYRYLFR